MTPRTRFGWALAAVTLVVIHAGVLDNVAAWCGQNWEILVAVPTTAVVWWWMAVTEDRA